VRNIQTMKWSDRQNQDVVNRRAGGRRRINAERKARVWQRRQEIKGLIGGCYILLGTPLARGLETKLAKHFGVNRSTICRDRDVMLREWRTTHAAIDLVQGLGLQSLLLGD
jgi:hypothetical protein